LPPEISQTQDLADTIDFSTILNPQSDPTSFLHNFDQSQPQSFPDTDFTRPRSATVYSDYSYTSTEVSDYSDNSHLGGGLTNEPVDLNLDGMNVWDQQQQPPQPPQRFVSPGEITNSSSVSPVNLEANSVGVVRGVGEDEAKRQARLEREYTNIEERRALRIDRRHINRKSAQKHRARRKEEAETMSRQIAERDSKIVQLEQALAVERAKLQQVLSWIKENATTQGKIEVRG
jgi:hypothetical protein